jgi:FHS family L-fucose permease-like MFS transporter
VPAAHSLLATLRLRRVYFGVLTIVLYIGAEATIGAFLADFAMSPDVAGLPPATAVRLVTYYWGGAMAGRLVGTVALRRFDPRRAAAIAALIAATLVATAASTHGHLAMWALVGVGLFNSIQFPVVFSLSIDGLGARAGTASSLLVLGSVGGAILPVLVGLLSDYVGVHRACALTIVSYGTILYFVLWVCKPQRPPAPELATG